MNGFDSNISFKLFHLASPVNNVVDLVHTILIINDSLINLILNTNELTVRKIQKKVTFLTIGGRGESLNGLISCSDIQMLLKI